MQLTAWKKCAEQALQGALERVQPLGGGDFASAYSALLRADNGDAVPLFIKTHSNPPAGFFTTEARGLAVLRAAAAASVPKVLAASDDPPYLALQWIDTSHNVVPDEVRFGRELAQMHAAGLPVFGRDDCRTTGSLALSNDPLDDWYDFYSQRRLLPLASIAAQRNVLPQKCIAQLENLAGHLPDFIDAPATAARLHGDLWAGNRLSDNLGQSWLIDPAMHGGHAEFDLAMMRLFGGFGEDCFSAYRELSPLQPGWQDRISLHQLAPLVVHAIKFGHSYLPAVQRALDQYS